MKRGSIFNTIDSWGPVLLRLALGIIFIAHGGQKVLGLFGGPGWEGTIAHFGQQMGIPMPLTVLIMAAEFLGGIGLIFGFLTRLAALGICAVMIGAMVKVHLAFGFFLNMTCAPNRGHGIEFNIALLAMALALVCFGPGFASVDRWLSMRR